MAAPAPHRPPPPKRHCAFTLEGRGRRFDSNSGRGWAIRSPARRGVRRVGTVTSACNCHHGAQPDIPGPGSMKVDVLGATFVFLKCCGSAVAIRITHQLSASSSNLH